MQYNRDMEKTNLAIIGGGAAGLFLANALPNRIHATLIERGERLGRKLSATGNGQGNITNLALSKTAYFSVENSAPFVRDILSSYDENSLRAFFQSRGVLCIADERERVYPASRQASALTDALRFSLPKNVDVRLQTKVIALQKEGNGFLLTLEKEGEQVRLYADKVVLCAGGKAAKNFGTDGFAYSLCKGLGHTITALYPSLVQLKTDTAHTKSLKGIRVNDAVVCANTRHGEKRVQGDVIFTDYGVSGDAIFRISAFLTAELDGVSPTLTLDFLPAFTEAEIYQTLLKKEEGFPEIRKEELLFGMVNNQLGRAIFRRANGDVKTAAKLVKAFTLPVLGSLGFDYAQITKGGVPLSEVDEGLQSRLCKGLYFAGEILDVDGECGGFNLQWAYSSARKVAEGIAKEWGQV